MKRAPKYSQRRKEIGTPSRGVKGVGNGALKRSIEMGAKFETIEGNEKKKNRRTADVIRIGIAKNEICWKQSAP